MAEKERTEYFKILTLEAKLIKQKYKTLGTGRSGKLSQWSGYIPLKNQTAYVSLYIPKNFPNEPPVIRVRGIRTNFNEELDILKNWRRGYHITDVLDALREYLERRRVDDGITKRLAEELQRMKEVSRTLLTGSEFVSIGIRRDTPSLREYSLRVTFSRYSRPKFRGRSITVRITLPEEYPTTKPEIEVSNGEEDVNLKIENYLENMQPLRTWSRDNYISEIALSILKFFDNLAPPTCPICLSKITKEEQGDAAQCRNPKCQSIYHSRCLEAWIRQGYKKECVVCGKPI